MASKDKITLFEKTPVPKAVLSLSVPMVLSSLVMVVYSLTDTYFVGMLNDPIQNAAVTLAAPMLLAFNAVNNLFGVGGSSMMSRALGVKDYVKVRKSSSFAFWCAAICAVLFALAYTLFNGSFLSMLGASAETWEATSAYLGWTVSCGAVPAILNVVMAYLVRSEGSALNASIGTISGCVVNMILDPIFILGMGMGAAGAGLATFLGNCFAIGYFFVFLFIKRGKTFVCIDPKMFRPTKEIAKEVFAVGVPASIQNLLNVTGMTILNNFAAGYGSSVVASLGIAMKVYQVPMQIALGMSQGVMPLIGYNYAAENISRMKNAMLFTYKLALSFLFLVTAAYLIFAEPIIRMFMQDPVIVDYGSFYLRGYALGLIPLVIDFIGVGSCQAMGKGGLTLFFAVMRKIVLEIPLIIIFNALLHDRGLCFAQGASELLLAVASVMILIRLVRKLEKAQKNNVTLQAETVSPDDI